MTAPWATHILIIDSLQPSMTGPLPPHIPMVGRYAQDRWQTVRHGKSVGGKLTMRSTKGFLVRASGGRFGKEGEEGELEIDAELASERELVRQARDRHLEALGWGWLGWVEVLGARAWELARDIDRDEGNPRKEELETMLCMRLGTLALLAEDS